MPGPPDLDATIDALRQAVGAGDRDAIAEHLAAIERRLEAMNPLLRGMTYAHVKSVLGQPQEAVAVVEDLIELMPDDGRVYYQLGCYRREARDDDGALAAFTRATELDGAMVDAWIHRGVLLDARGEPQGAVEAYRHAILRAPTEVDAWRNLGNSLAAMGCFGEAIEAYRTATGLRPDDPTLGFLVASAHQAQGDLAQANAVLPAAMRDELGPAIEVVVSSAGVTVGCRLHARASREAVLRAAAERLLQGVGQALAEQDPRGWPVAREDSFVVRHQQRLLLCDVDPVRPGLPHRFFDATGVVGRAARDIG